MNLICGVFAILFASLDFRVEAVSNGMFSDGQCSGLISGEQIPGHGPAPQGSAPPYTATASATTYMAGGDAIMGKLCFKSASMILQVQLFECYLTRYVLFT